MGMPNIFVNLMPPNAYKVSVIYFCHTFFSLKWEWIQPRCWTFFVRTGDIDTDTQVFPQHRRAEVIQQQRAKCARRCLQLPIWSVAHTAIRHYPKTFKAFCMCCFMHLPNSLFKEHLTEVWQVTEWFQVCSSQEAEKCIFEASEENHLHISFSTQSNSHQYPILKVVFLAFLSSWRKPPYTFSLYQYVFCSSPLNSGKLHA